MKSPSRILPALVVLALSMELQAQQNEAFRRAQMAQEYTLAQQQMEAQRQQAMLAATGRNQAPNVKWMRRS